MCLEADPGPDFRYRVTTQPCNHQNNPAQQWTEFTDGGFTKFRNNAVGRCLDAHVPIPTLANEPVILWDCSATYRHLSSPAGWYAGFGSAWRVSRSQEAADLWS